jgi:hypothetical protein
MSRRTGLLVGPSLYALTFRRASTLEERIKCTCQAASRPQFCTFTEADFIPCFRHVVFSLEVIFISHGVLQLLRVVANQRTARVLDEIRPRFLCALPS